MKKNNKKIFKIEYQILSIFFGICNFCFADTNYKGFERLFKEGAKIGGGSVIEKMVNSLFYGLIVLYRGISSKLSQILGFIILAFMIINILKIILQNVEKVDLYSILKMLLPSFIKNLIIAFVFITPVSYKINLGFENTFGNKTVKGTLLTEFTEIFFSMFYKLGLIVFSSEKFRNITPGKLADNFISTPLNLLQNVLKFKTFFAIFINIAKIILLIFCVWICAKIISKYIVIIFETLMLMIFSTFYLIFFLLESTSQIAQKGLNIIIIQIITVFMAAAMMGVSYQLLNLISVGNSILGISSLVIALMLAEKTIENIDFIAMTLTSG